MKTRNSIVLDFCGTIVASLIAGVVSSALLAALVLVLSQGATATGLQ